ncbi:MAG: hypothetical protein CEE42_05225 [Promethearchaeota archaeon Loki_b31]|nr:MAG: hypothetical protein CEE42_05225 [Candidatus Lokiarchaeota archaeon Loki_b31]
MLDITIGVITFSVTTVLSFLLWLFKRKKDFKKLYKSITGEKADAVVIDKSTFKLKYNFYKKLIKLLIDSIKKKYLADVFKNGEVDYEKMVKEILDFIGNVNDKSDGVTA